MTAATVARRGAVHLSAMPPSDPVAHAGPGPATGDWKSLGSWRSVMPELDVKRKRDVYDDSSYWN